MLGRSIADPSGIESSLGSASGLGLLAVDTTLAREKITTVRSAITRGSVRFSGYEIHVGETTVDPTVEPFATLDDGRPEGACAEGVIGTYLHGAFEHPGVCAEVFGVPLAAVATGRGNYEQLADWFGAHVRHVDALGIS